MEMLTIGKNKEMGCYYYYFLLLLINAGCLEFSCMEEASGLRCVDKEHLLIKNSAFNLFEEMSRG